MTNSNDGWGNPIGNPLGDGWPMPTQQPNGWPLQPPFAAPNAPVEEAKPEAKLDDPISDAMKARLEKERLPQTPDGVLMLWERTKKALAEAKEDEMEIRKTAVQVYVPQPREGMNTVDLGGGYALKAAIKYNYKLDPDNAKVEAALDRIEALGNEGKFVAERLVSWTPNFLLTEYRKLQDDAETGSVFAKEALKIVGEILTITDAAPTLEIKEPKKKK